MVRPRAFAVLRLITSSNLMGCSTGRSAGVAPFRILSTYVRGRAAPVRGDDWPIAYEAAGLHRHPCGVHGRQAARGRELYEPCAVHREHGVPQDEERARARAGHGREGAVELVGIARLQEG